MNNKIKEIKDGFIKSQLEIIDEIINNQNKLNIADSQDKRLFDLLEGFIYSVVFRLKGIINILNQISEEKIEIEEKYEKYFKIIKETAYFKGDELILLISGANKETELPISEIINTIKASKNGEHKKE